MIQTLNKFAFQNAGLSDILAELSLFKVKSKAIDRKFLAFVSS